MTINIYLVRDERIKVCVVVSSVMDVSVIFKRTILNFYDFNILKDVGL